MNPNSRQDIEARGAVSPALTFAAWFAVGLVTGGAVGLLLAPAPGRDTRDAISARAGFAAESTRIYLDKAREIAQNFVETAQEQASRLSEAMTAGFEEARRTRDEMAGMDPDQHPEQES